MNAELLTQINAFSPDSAAEAKAKALLIRLLAERGDRLFQRESEDIHITVSAMILDPSLQQTLMVFHHIYRSFCWTGGHADGEQDLLAVALREAGEETGAAELYPLSGAILSIDLLPVPAHEKYGKAVAAHKHITITYGLIADTAQKLAIKADENSAVAWLPTDELSTHCSEAHMLPIYDKLLQRMRRMVAEKESCLSALPELLLPWYAAHARPLPWRQDHQPYHVWLSEIMLQQTRVEAVKRYYSRFIASLPDIRALAEAPEDALFKLWEGLGYYSRARNLQRAARQICTQHNGCFPQDYVTIRALPGIGDYTAGAICSICFDQTTPAVDGNVLRLLSRLREDFRCSDLPAIKKEAFHLLQPLYCRNPGHRSELTQGLMEIGATVCLPKGRPHCEICPLQKICLAYRSHSADRLPLRSRKRPRRNEMLTVFLLQLTDGRIAVRRRPAQGLLAAMWELPNLNSMLNDQAALQQAHLWGVQPQAMRAAIQRNHIFTHIEWQMTCYHIICAHAAAGFTWASAQQLEGEIALPSAFRQFLTAAGLA